MMKPILATIISLIFMAAAQAEGPAGIVLYCRNGEDVYLLLADDADGVRGWSAFGGKADYGETAAETAARETEEETRGYFRSEWLAEQIKDQKPVTSNGFSMFFVEVPFVPAQRVENNPLAEEDPGAMTERANFAWIPASDVTQALRENRLQINPLYLPSSHTSNSYWNVWIRNMRDAYERGAYPWSKN